MEVENVRMEKNMLCLDFFFWYHVLLILFTEKDKKIRLGIYQFYSENVCFVETPVHNIYIGYHIW